MKTTATIAVLFLIFFSATVPAASATGRVHQRMKPVPGGTFLMGYDKSKVNQRPVHQVTISMFYMDSAEVTQKDFITVMSSQPFPFGLKGLPESSGLGDKYPMYNIGWYDMVLYCNAISKEEGYDTVYTYDSLSDTVGVNGRLHGVSIDYSKVGYRLPTEAEWEYACRAGTTTDFFWGDEPAGIYAWFMDNSDRKSQPVGSKSPNRWGLYDMCGNVYDFCNDWYAPYDSGAQTDPHGPDTGSLRTARGGNMLYDSSRMQSAERMSIEPEVRYLYYGFRCVLPAPNSIGTINRRTYNTPQSNSRVRFVLSSQLRTTSFSKQANSYRLYSLNGKLLGKVSAIREIQSMVNNGGGGAFLLEEE